VKYSGKSLFVFFVYPVTKSAVMWNVVIRVYVTELKCRHKCALSCSRHIVDTRCCVLYSVRHHLFAICLPSLK